MDIEGYLHFVRENTLSEREVDADILAGRCRRVAAISGRSYGVQYADGRRLDFIDGRFYTPEGFVALFWAAHMMSTSD